MRYVNLLTYLQLMRCGVQIVNGGPLPANVIHEPVSAFDEHGRYVGESVGVAIETDLTASASVDAEVNCIRTLCADLLHDT